MESSQIKAGTEAQGKEFPNSPTSPFSALSVEAHIPQILQLEENPWKMWSDFSTTECEMIHHDSVLGAEKKREENSMGNVL